jgi:regulator of sigma E protease
VHLEEVSPNSPASQAGLQVKDEILKVNGQSVEGADWFSTAVKANLDKPLELLIERGGQQMTITVTPLSSRPASEGALGILMEPERRAATLGEITRTGFLMTGLQAGALIYLPVALIQGAVQPEEARFVGLKGIFDMVNQAVQRDVSTRQVEPTAPGTAPVRPMPWTLYIMGLLSVSLGVINLFPIPALDGGRILFTLPEIFFHRRIPMEFENAVNGVAMLLLIALMLFINVMDFIRPATNVLP